MQSSCGEEIQNEFVCFRIIENNYGKGKLLPIHRVGEAERTCNTIRANPTFLMVTYYKLQ